MIGVTHYSKIKIRIEELKARLAEVANYGLTERVFVLCALFDYFWEYRLCCHLLFYTMCYSSCLLTFKFSGDIKSLVTGPASRKNVYRISSVKISHRIT